MFSSDAAAVLIQDDQIAAAVEEAKLTRRKQSGCCRKRQSRPAWILAGLRRRTSTTSPWPAPCRRARIWRLRCAVSPRRKSFPWIITARMPLRHGWRRPFERATVITLDRAGDLRCGAKWRAEGTRLSLEEEILFPNSIGELYGRITEMLGFRARSDEHHDAVAFHRRRAAHAAASGGN